MARFLSPEWFDEVAAATDYGTTKAGGADPDAGRLVVHQVVTGTPDGEVRYAVVIAAGRATLQPAPDTVGGTADLTITVDWPTACAIAQGELSAQRALLDGRLRVRGNLTRLDGPAAELAGQDPVPPEVRRRTTYSA